jgi:DDB1- and CUL4-associated factor 17
MDKLTSSRIGVEPFNLPLNADISEKLSSLFEVTSYQGELVIGANPWHYITKRSATQLEVLTFETRKIVLASENKYLIQLPKMVLNL